MHAGAYLDTQAWHVGRYRAGTSDRVGRRVKGRHEPITHHLDFSAAMLLQLAPDQLVVTAKHVVPKMVAELGRLLGRTDYVSEKNRGQDSLRLALFGGSP
jgi:hypothetical protein